MREAVCLRFLSLPWAGNRTRAALSPSISTAEKPLPSTMEVWDGHNSECGRTHSCRMWRVLAVPGKKRQAKGRMGNHARIRTHTTTELHNKSYLHHAPQGLLHTSPCRSVAQIRENDSPASKRSSLSLNAPSCKRWRLHPSNLRVLIADKTWSCSKL